MKLVTPVFVKLQAQSHDDIPGMWMDVLNMGSSGKHLDLSNFNIIVGTHGSMHVECQIQVNSF